jgi:hypothetical protein
MDTAPNVLTASENAELLALLRLVERGRLRPDSEQWARYLKLFEANQKGDRTKLDAPDFELSTGTGAEGQAALAQRYRVTERTIRRWIDAGREGNEFPPLYNPAEMPAWWERLRDRGVFKHRVPQEIEAAAAQARQDQSLTKVPEPEADKPPRRYEITEEEKRPDMLMARLEQEEARLHRRYLDALEEEADERDLDVHRRRWTEVSDLLQLQRVRYQKDRSLLSEEQVTLAFTLVVKPLPAALEKCLLRNPPRPDESWPAAVRRVVRSAFACLPDTLEEMLNA